MMQLTLAKYLSNGFDFFVNVFKNERKGMGCFPMAGYEQLILLLKNNKSFVEKNYIPPSFS